MAKPKFTPGPRRVYQDPQGDWHVDNWSPRSGNHDGLIVARFGYGPFSEGNAKLDAAAPDLYAYAEAEEACANLEEFNDTRWEDLDTVEIARLRWKLIDRLFPELAAQCPPVSREEWEEWFGSGANDRPYPEIDYLTREEWWGDAERTTESIYHKIDRYVAGLRNAALAKARGEEAPHD